MVPSRLSACRPLALIPSNRLPTRSQSTTVSSNLLPRLSWTPGRILTRMSNSILTSERPMAPTHPSQSSSIRLGTSSSPSAALSLASKAQVRKWSSISAIPLLIGRGPRPPGTGCAAAHCLRAVALLGSCDLRRRWWSIRRQGSYRRCGT